MNMNIEIIKIDANESLIKCNILMIVFMFS